MSTDSISPPARSSSPAAQRMRHYRKQRRQGLRSVRILLDETDIDALIRLRLLKEDQRQDVEALQTADLGTLSRAEGGLAGRVTVARPDGGPPPFDGGWKWCLPSQDDQNSPR